MEKPGKDLAPFMGTLIAIFPIVAIVFYVTLLLITGSALDFFRDSGKAVAAFTFAYVVLLAPAFCCYLTSRFTPRRWRIFTTALVGLLTASGALLILAPSKSAALATFASPFFYFVAASGALAGAILAYADLTLNRQQDLEEGR